MIKVWITEEIGNLTGTATFANGSPTVTGSGTDFQNEVAVGDIIQPSDDDQYWGQVLTIPSATVINLESNWQGSSGGGKTVYAREAYPFELKASNLTVSGWSDNRSVIPTRDGTEVLLEDPKNIYPTRLMLNIHQGDIDEVSSRQKASADVYFSTYLYWAFRYKEDIHIMAKSSKGVPLPYYLGRILDYDAALAGIATENEAVPLHLPFTGGAPEMFTHLLWIREDGAFTDWDALGTATFVTRYG